MNSLLVAAVIAASAGQPPAADDRATIVSADRIRARLERPPSKLTLPPKTPDFTIEIREREQVNRFMTPILDFTVAPGVPQNAAVLSPFGSQPLFTIDLLPIASAARRALANRAAREEVSRSIAAYCAAQPERGAGIQICARTTRQ